MSEKEAREQAALSLEVEGDGVAWLVFDTGTDRPNLLRAEVMARLDALLGEIEQGARARRIRAVVVRSGKDGAFIAGADVNEIGAIRTEADGEAGARAGQRVFLRLDRLSVPVVAAVDGLCLGGGTELILACDYRLASDRRETKIGLPEIRLGIIPGFGGTTRLPPLVGLRAALDLILTGRPVDARKAQRIGLIDERLHPAQLYARAHAVAIDLAEGRRPPRARRGLLQRALEDTRPGRRLILAQARKTVRRETGGHYPAPLAALEVIEQSRGKSLEAGLAIEARALGRLIVSDVARNLVHVFHLLEATKKAGPPGVAPRAVQQAAVLGAGVMGGGIAQLLAANGIDVRLKDIRADALGSGLRHARDLFEKAVQRRRLTRRELQRAMDRIAPTLSYDGFGRTDLVIEAVLERMNVKQEVLREVEGRVGADTVLTSNTSSLSVTEMQRALARPENFCGMHFFNPVHRMPLVEVVRGELSSDEAVATVFALARRLEKTPVIVRDGPGFLVNRILAPYLNEAGWLLTEGAKVEDIDRALRDFGMPMGPLRLLDEVGLDVARHAGRVMADAFGERLAAPPPMRALEHSKLLGRKGGIGFYRYEGEQPKGVNPEIYATLGAASASAATPPGADEIRERAVLAMINEAARALGDGIAARPGDVDVAMITGTGFPPFRGGLLRYADSLGTSAVLTRMERLEHRHGERFEPAPLLRERAASGRGFYDG
jgi:3-hydroxyacyl-CoA dehydrogenase/enoyl-CoA hydratase/3-hydroxybutyryl-CoA epimerase